MVTSNTTFKKQMVEARRTQILMGAAHVFAEKGFHKATTKQIAKAAGVAEGTIYNYFKNKRELLLAMVKQLGAQSLKEVVFDHASDDPKPFLTALLHDRYHLMEQHGPILAPIFAEIMSDPPLREMVYQQIMKPAIKLIEQYIQTQIDVGKFNPINPVIATRALVGAMVFNGVLKLASLDSRYDTISPEALIEQLVSLFVDGLLVH